MPAAADRRLFADEIMAVAFDAALDHLRSIGCQIIDLPEDFCTTADLLYEGAWIAERYQSRAAE